VPVAADGNCFFRSVSYLLFQKEDKQWPLRNIILRFENLNSTLFEKRMTDVNESTFSAHIQKLINPSTWATHIEVLAVATYFQVPVYFCVDPPRQSTGGAYCWECFSPLVCANLRYPIITEPFLDDAHKVPRFELVYYTNCHYNAIVSVQTGLLHATPPRVSGKVSFHEQIIE
jgi:hypothetical protein